MLYKIFTLKFRDNGDQRNSTTIQNILKNDLIQILFSWYKICTSSFIKSIISSIWSIGSMAEKLKYHIFCVVLSI